MPRLIFTPEAVQDIERLREFLRPKDPAAAQRAALAIIQGVQSLAEMPLIGRPVEGLSEAYRDWLIDFGDAGYVVRYRFEGEIVAILTVWHQREAGF